MKRLLCLISVLSVLLYTVTAFSAPVAAAGDESGNCDLSSIECEYAQLVPELSPDETSYTLYIASDCTRLVIVPKAQSALATCASIDITLNKEQEPEIPIICTAGNGTAKEYKIKIKRSDKTLAQIKAEIRQNGGFVLYDENKSPEKTEIIVCAVSSAAGLLIIFILYKIFKKKLINPVDSNEKPFYRQREST